MDRKFSEYKWVGLITFALMYNLVYLGRFNVNNMMTLLAQDMNLTAARQEMVAMSVFISYALGSFINGYLADRIGAKKVVILGGTVSAFLNMAVAFQTKWVAVLLLWLTNGYFQSMIWVGGVALLANWWQEGERGKGIGIANFSSGMSHATAYLIPAGMMAAWPDMDWRVNFVLPMIILLAFTYIFGAAAVEKPEDRGLSGYEIKNHRHSVREKSLLKIAGRKEGPWRYFFSQKKFWWWCGIAMLSSVCRYGLLNWIPLYYEEVHGGKILSSTFSNLTLPIGMACGTLIITWIAGTKLFDNKGIIVTAMAALCGTLIVIFPMIEDTRAVLVGIFFTGFALYGINGILWLHAIDQGCRVFPGSAAGIFNGFAYLGACAEGVLFPAVINFFGDKMSVFVVMEGLCIGMVICGMVVSKKNTVIMPELRE
ncbi:MFS transporter [Anaerovorax odorimutans]|uniref:MFS transporter n=1 Tax=Anaerovorax odorimutans TaxID=109327 RepID=A0ABT1RNV6_9FIRM|nr:MFS transporter [Anaerovorax odorimutans]MCQ4636874.1 MFS transporter [Anaerovorax odorimutans]